MSVNLRAEFKDTLARMTVATLRAALDDLEVHAGVPQDAAIKVSHYQQGWWEVVATWTPEAKPAEALPAPGGVVFNIHPSPGLEEDALAIAERIQRDTRGVRRIKDNPQE